MLMVKISWDEVTSEVTDDAHVSVHTTTHRSLFANATRKSDLVYRILAVISNHLQKGTVIEVLKTIRDWKSSTNLQTTVLGSSNEPIRIHLIATGNSREIVDSE